MDSVERRPWRCVERETRTLSDGTNTPSARLNSSSEGNVWFVINKNRWACNDGGGMIIRK